MATRIEYVVVNERVRKDGESDRIESSFSDKELALHQAKTDACNIRDGYFRNGVVSGSVTVLERKIEDAEICKHKVDSEYA